MSRSCGMRKIPESGDCESDPLEVGVSSLSELALASVRGRLVWEKASSSSIFFSGTISADACGSMFLEYNTSVYQAPVQELEYANYPSCHDWNS